MDNWKKIISCIFLIAVGIFVLAGSIFNWDSFFSSAKAQAFVKLFGRTGARIFYAIIGLFITFCGIMVLVTS